MAKINFKQTIKQVNGEEFNNPTQYAVLTVDRKELATSPNGKPIIYTDPTELKPLTLADVCIDALSYKPEKVTDIKKVFANTKLAQEIYDNDEVELTSDQKQDIYNNLIMLNYNAIIIGKVYQALEF